MILVHSYDKEIVKVCLIMQSFSYENFGVGNHPHSHNDKEPIFQIDVVLCLISFLITSIHDKFKDNYF